MAESSSDIRAAAARERLMVGISAGNREQAVLTLAFNLFQGESCLGWSTFT
jgi:hypothetical protein